MRRILVLCLGGVFLVGGCPSQDYPAVNEVLTVGNYVGIVNCTSTSTDKADQASTPEMTVQVAETGQVYIWGAPYFVGLELDMSDPNIGVTGSVTIKNIANDAATKTLAAVGDGTLSSGPVTYATTHNVTLVQTSDTQMQVTYVTSGDSAAAAKTFAITCGGTLAR
jgi:hypothetical protein